MLAEGVSAEGVGLAMGTRMMSAPTLRWICAAGPDDAMYKCHVEERTIGAPQDIRGRAGLPRQPGQPGEPVTGRILHADYRPQEFLISVLVFEFECPFDGYEHPVSGSIVEVHTGGGEVVRAVVEGESSTYPGPQTAGLTLRLHLRFKKPVSVRGGDLLVVMVSDQAIIELTVEL